MRAPPASNKPMIGARAFSAMSCILKIFCACVSESEPPNTVKSFENTKTARPLTVPQPVTTPSPGIFERSMPKSVARCWTNMSSSSKEPWSMRSSMRSRAVSLPRACCAAMRFSPPPSRASLRRSSSLSRMCFMRSRPPKSSGGGHSMSQWERHSGRAASKRGIGSDRRLQGCGLVQGPQREGGGDHQDAAGEHAEGIRSEHREPLGVEMDTGEYRGDIHHPAPVRAHAPDADRDQRQRPSDGEHAGRDHGAAAPHHADRVVVEE